MKTILKAVLISAALVTASYSQASEVLVTNDMREESCEVVGDFGFLAKKAFLLGKGKETFNKYVEISESLDTIDMHLFTLTVLSSAYNIYPDDLDTTKTVDEKSAVFGRVVKEHCLEQGIY